MCKKTNTSEEKSGRSPDLPFIISLFSISIAIIVPVVLAIFGNNKLLNITRDIQSNTDNIGFERTLMTMYKTEEAAKWNALSTVMAVTREPTTATPTKSTTTATSTPLIACPWAISSPDITKEFQFSCPDNLIIKSVGGDLLKLNGYTYLDLSNISEITFTSMVTEIPFRSDFSIKGNYEVYFQFVEYSAITWDAEFTNYFNFRFYPLLRTYDNSQYWVCCGFDSEDKLYKEESKTVKLPTFKEKTQIKWVITKTDEGIRVKVKLPDTPNWYDMGTVVSKDHFSRPALIIGYSNPQSCKPSNCSLDVTISDIDIK